MVGQGQRTVRKRHGVAQIKIDNRHGRCKGHVFLGVFYRTAVRACQPTQYLHVTDETERK